MRKFLLLIALAGLALACGTPAPSSQDGSLPTLEGGYTLVNFGAPW